MNFDVEKLYQAGFFSIVEQQFASMSARISGETSPRVLLGAALALSRSNLGDVCVDIPAIAGQPILLPDRQDTLDLKWPDTATWLRELSVSPLVSSGKLTRPLVLDDAGRLYLYQFYQKEKDLAARLLTRAARTPDDIDASLLDSDLTSLFGDPSEEGSRSRRAAAKNAVRRLLTVVTGGPGSGKTTLVLGILLLICRQFISKHGRPPHIELLAPTGKAAQRIAETIQHGRDSTLEKIGVVDDAVIREAMPTTAATIHRVLHRLRRKDRRPENRAQRFLRADVVVVDEASMVDLSLMHDLLRRIKPEARLIVVGDKDQLASVESGALLADIYDASVASDRVLSKVTVHLEGSYRFGKDGGIGRLAKAINAADAAAAIEILKNDPSGQVTFQSVSDAAALYTSLFEVAHPLLQEMVEASAPQEALQALARFRILSAHRSGPFGQRALNRYIENRLETGGRIRRDALDYLGRPVLVTRNNYAEQLFNGDVGIIAKDAHGNRSAVFETTEGHRTVLSSALPDVETVFAMTVHKSQGSEFDTVLLVLPLSPSPILVRELLYTAVTRAKTKLAVFGTESVIHQAILSKTERASGLKDRLLTLQPS